MPRNVHPAEPSSIPHEDGGWHDTCSGPTVPVETRALLWPALIVLMAGCAEDKPRELGLSPAQPHFPIEIQRSPRLESVPTGEEATLGGPARVRCGTCHDVVDIGEVATTTSELRDFHQGLTFAHGDLSCSSCHEPKQPLSLHLATGQRVAMSDAMDLCSQCHGLQRRSYDHNAHGGLDGYWDLSRGPRLKNNCVDCHDPHLPAIGQVSPTLHPRDRGHYVERTHQ